MKISPDRERVTSTKTLADGSSVPTLIVQWAEKGVGGVKHLVSRMVDFSTEDAPDEVRKEFVPIGRAGVRPKTRAHVESLIADPEFGLDRVCSCIYQTEANKTASATAASKKATWAEKESAYIAANFKKSDYKAVGEFYMAADKKSKVEAWWKNGQSQAGLAAGATPIFPAYVKDVIAGTVKILSK